MTFEFNLSMRSHDRFKHVSRMAGEPERDFALASAVSAFPTEDLSGRRHDCGGSGFGSGIQ